MSLGRWRVWCGVIDVTGPRTLSIESVRWPKWIDRKLPPMLLSKKNASDSETESTVPRAPLLAVTELLSSFPILPLASKSFTLRKTGDRRP